jgi:hypothetical protein
MIKVAYLKQRVWQYETAYSLTDQYFSEKREINFEYNSVSFNEELSFPYSVPNGYKRILIK